VTSSDRADRPLFLVTVGTDHHPFDRLTGWIDGWLQATGPDRVRCIVQGGTSQPSRLGEATAYLGAPEMETLMKEAAAVVTHGGPATLAECARLGVIPIVVPRRKSHGEHVNDHQVAFVDRMATDGTLVVARSREELSVLLDRALSDPEAFRAPPRDGASPEVVRRFGRLVEEMVASRKRSDAGPDEPGDRRIPDPVTLLFIGGWGRSGSTLLGRMLGQLPGFVLGGELRQLWARAAEDGDCGCGRSFRTCDFWRAVGERAFGGWDRVDLGRLQKLRSSVDRPWTLPVLLSATNSGSRRTREYVDALGRVYRAIAEVGGARVVIDTSKIPTHALLARKVPNLDLRVIHLVRDSRGVALSWQKHASRPQASGAQPMPRYGPMAAGGRYVLYNLQTHLLGALGRPYVLSRYEDLVANPSAELGRILRAVVPEADAEALPFLDDSRVHLEVDHTVDGNPMRFATGAATLNLDEAWRDELARTDRFLVSAVTAPLLVRYAYPIRTGGGRSKDERR
jgi:UDP-N-acetylglucosamine transferase subunit ALG13